LVRVVFEIPLLYTTVYGPLPPVIVTLKLAVEPAQILVVPLNTEALGRAITVTTLVGALLVQVVGVNGGIVSVEINCLLNSWVPAAKGKGE
jgi:hypothetical protein